VGDHFGAEDYRRVRDLVRGPTSPPPTAGTARSIDDVTDTVTRNVMQDLDVTLEPRAL
jgi:hypothetical protein